MFYEKGRASYFAPAPCRPVSFWEKSWKAGVFISGHCGADGWTKGGEEDDASERRKDGGTGSGAWRL